jgi:hypothetical protein
MKSEKEKNMIKYYSDVRKFFKNVQINGSLKERTKTVQKFVELVRSGNHYVIANVGDGDLAWNIYVKNGHSKFHNNGVDFAIGEQANGLIEGLGGNTIFKNYKKFKRNVLFVIDVVEKEGGSSREKRDLFLDIYSGFINIIVHTCSSSGSLYDSSFYFINGWYLKEIRGRTIYEVWIQ